MPTTSDGKTVYADFEDVQREVQSDPNTFSLSTQGSPSEWQEFLEAKQVAAKARIDEFCNRDFEDHTGATVTLDGGMSATHVLALPSPVRQVTAVREDGAPLDDSQYRLLGDTDQLVRLDENGETGTWAAGFGNLEVDVDWGYQTPPADVAEAEAKLVANGIATLAQMREGLVVQQDDVDLQVSLPSAMTPEIRGMLAEHRPTSHGVTML